MPAAKFAAVSRQGEHTHGKPACRGEETTQKCWQPPLQRRADMGRHHAIAPASFAVTKRQHGVPAAMFVGERRRINAGQLETTGQTHSQ